MDHAIQCMACRTPMSANSRVCPRCGTSRVSDRMARPRSYDPGATVRQASQRTLKLPLRRANATPGRPAAKASPGSTCIVCSGAGVQRVSSAYHRGRWTAIFTGGSTAATFLAPPETQHAHRTPGAALLLFTGLGLVLATIGLHDHNGAGIPGLMLLLVAACILLIKSQRQITVSGSEDVRREQSLTRWHELFYCPRCDHVYHPGDQGFVRSAQMNALL